MRMKYQLPEATFGLSCMNQLRLPDATIGISHTSQLIEAKTRTQFNDSIT